MNGLVRIGVWGGLARVCRGSGEGPEEGGWVLMFCSFSERSSRTSLYRYQARILDTHVPDNGYRVSISQDHDQRQEAGVHALTRGVVLRTSRKWWFYNGKVRDPRAEEFPGAAWVSGWARGRSVEVFRRDLESSGECFGYHFDSKIVRLESKALPERFLKVER